MTRAVAVRTSKLVVGDIVQFGNMFDGFSHATIADIKGIPGRPYSRKVHIRFNHSGIAEVTYGVGSIWYVVKAEHQLTEGK